ncbi:MAG: LamG domain-containing protein [Deltaproteobacteria bacterium]|nr:MAG: LamG domain-containing protein [Deltaproteobacteria bacterium]
MRQACKQWVLAGAVVCALAGLMLMATDPVGHHEAPSRRVREQHRRAARRAVPRVASPIEAYDREAGLPAAAPVAAPEDEPALGAAPPQPAVVHDGAWFADQPPYPAFGLALASPPAAARADEQREPAERPARRTRVGRRLRGTHRRPARDRRGMAEQASGSTGGQPPADVPTAPASATPSPQPVTSANDDPAASHDVAFQSGDVQFPTAGRVAIPIDAKIQHEGSVSLWVQPGWQAGNEDDATLVQLGDRLRLKKNVDVLRLEAADVEAGNARDTPDLGVPITDWNPGEWHHVAATWKDDSLSLYVDGDLVGRRGRHGRVDLPPDGELLVGSDVGDGAPVAPGLIGRVDVRNRALGDDEVAKEFHDAVGGDDQPGRGQGPHDGLHDRGNGSDDHGNGNGKANGTGDASDGQAADRGRAHGSGRTSSR